MLLDAEGLSHELWVDSVFLGYILQLFLLFLVDGSVFYFFEVAEDMSWTFL